MYILNFVKKFFKYNYIKLLFLSIFFLSCWSLSKQESIEYSLEIKSVNYHPKGYTYLLENKDSENIINHSDIIKELNNSDKYENGFSEGDVLKFKKLSIKIIVFLILCISSAILSLVSLSSDNEWGFNIYDVKSEVFFESFESIQIENINNSPKIYYIYKNRIICQSKYPLSAHSIYEHYKASNFNDFIIYDIGSTSKSKKSKSKSKIKNISKIIE
jgi:hypothetical protein